MLAGLLSLLSYLYTDVSEFRLKHSVICCLHQLSLANIKGAGGLHQDFLEIDFLVVSDRGE